MSYLLYLMFRCDKRCDGCDGKFGNFVGTKHTLCLSDSSSRWTRKDASAEFLMLRAGNEHWTGLQLVGDLQPDLQLGTRACLPGWHQSAGPPLGLAVHETLVLVEPTVIGLGQCRLIGNGPYSLRSRWHGNGMESAPDLARHSLCTDLNISVFDTWSSGIRCTDRKKKHTPTPY